MVFLEWGGTGLLFIAHKVKFVAWAYDYQAGSDHVCLSQTLSDVDHQRADRSLWPILAHRKNITI